MKIKKSQIIIGSVSTVLAIAIAITGIQIANRANDIIKKKKIIEHKELQYADEEFADYIDDVIEDTMDLIDDSDEDLFDEDEIEEVIGEDEEDEDNFDWVGQEEDNFDWIGQEEENTEFKKEYTSAIQLNGSTPKTSSVRDVNIKTSKVAYKDFIGYGASLFPEILSDVPVSGWYNSVAWEFEKQKVNNNKPKVSRLVIDMDAIITNTEAQPMRMDFLNNSDYVHYTNGEYDFINDSANSFWQVVDCLSKAGAYLTLDSGWKCAERIKVWYPDVSNDYANSAPYDINAFVRANIAWLLECQRRGYSIKYINFGNEIDWGGDFKTHQEILVYYTVLATTMSKAMDYAKTNDVSYKAINADGTFTKYTSKLTMDTEMLLADTAARDGSVSWQNKLFAALKKTIGDKVPKYSSIHLYYAPAGAKNDYDYEDVYNFFGKYREEMSPRILIQEFFAAPAEIDADYHKTADKEHDVWVCGDWDRSYASYIIAAANTGISSVNNWEYGTSFYPLVSNIKGIDYCDGAGAQFASSNTATGYRVTTNYRLTSLFGNYVDAHSDVLQCDWEGDDIRVASFKLPDGGYTFVIEAKKSEDARTLNIKLDKKIGKLYRYKFVDSKNDIKNRDLRGTIAQSDKTFTNVTTVTDTLDNDYCVYFYSTKPPVAQVELDKAVDEITKSDTLTINASLLDCESGAKIKYSISAASQKIGKSLIEKDIMGDVSRCGTISDNGNGKCVYTPGANAKSGDSVAIRATLCDSSGNETDTYAVAIVYIK